MSAPPPSQLDSGQILPAVYDGSGRLRVDAEVTANISAAQEVIISDVDDSIKIGDGTGTYADVTAFNALKTDSSATTQPISAVSLPLPSGAATSANQFTEISSLASIDTKVTSQATAAKQDTGNASLAAIDINTDNLDVALSTRLKPSDTLNAVTTVGTITNVVHVDDNSGSLTVDNSGTFAVQAAQSGTWNINNISGVVSLPTGSATSTLQTTGNTSLSSIDTKLDGVISTGNSSTSPLGISGVFTGTWEEVKNYSFFSISIFTDQNSITDGLAFQWSSNGTNIDSTESSGIVANTGRAFSISTRARYFRIVFTNDGVAQTVFRLQTIYHRFGSGVITKPLDGAVTTENVAQLVQAPVMAKLVDNSFINIAGISLGSNGLLGTADSTTIYGNQGQQFQATVDAVSTGSTSEVALCLFDNPNTSTKIVRLDKFVFGIPSQTNSLITYRLYMSPTVTSNGTTITPVGNRQTSQNSALANLYSLPTVSAFGNKFMAVRTDNTGVAVLYDFKAGRLIEPNNKLLITAQQSTSASSGSLSIEYSES